MINIQPAAKAALRALNDNGFEAYLVGGCVRDVLMGGVSHDIDITTNALPDQIMGVFSAFRTIPTGLKHGTVTVIIDSEPVEITTYRSESGYSDGRHPDSVKFEASLEKDLSRRDFTVNALCCDIDGEIFDLFGGREDLRLKTIRAIGNPYDRFSEDSLRILRALRFSSVFGFEIEKNTSKAVFDLKELIKRVSAERIYSELKRLLCGKNVESVLTDYFEVFETIIPELSRMKGFEQKNPHHCFDVWRHTAKVVASVEPVAELRLAALFHDCGKPDSFSIDQNGIGHFYGHSEISAEKAKTALDRLKADNETKKTVVELVRIHDTPVDETKKAARRRLNRYGEDLYRKLIRLQRADTLGLAEKFHTRLPHFERLEELLDEVLAEGECFSLKDLAVNGSDLQKLGLKGKQIGVCLNMLLEAVMNNEVNNNKNELIEYLEKHEKN